MMFCYYDSCLVVTAEKLCGRPDPKNGNIESPESGEFKKGSYVVKCDDGYNINAGVDGSLVWKCEKGNWINQPSCTRSNSFILIINPQSKLCFFLTNPEGPCAIADG